MVNINERTLNTIKKKLPELIASAAQRNIDKICIHEYRYYHIKLELKYPDPANLQIYVSASAWKKPISAAIGVVFLIFMP